MYPSKYPSLGDAMPRLMYTGHNPDKCLKEVPGIWRLYFQSKPDSVQAYMRCFDPPPQELTDINQPKDVDEYEDDLSDISLFAVNDDVILPGLPKVTYPTIHILLNEHRYDKAEDIVPIAESVTGENVEDKIAKEVTSTLPEELQKECFQSDQTNGNSINDLDASRSDTVPKQQNEAVLHIIKKYFEEARSIVHDGAENKDSKLAMARKRANFSMKPYLRRKVSSKDTPFSQETLQDNIESQPAQQESITPTCQTKEEKMPDQTDGNSNNDLDASRCDTVSKQQNEAVLHIIKKYFEEARSIVHDGAENKDSRLAMARKRANLSMKPYIRRKFDTPFSQETLQDNIESQPTQQESITPTFQSKKEEIPGSIATTSGNDKHPPLGRPKRMMYD